VNVSGAPRLKRRAYSAMKAPQLLPSGWRGTIGRM
jgi:hypothetical protein